MERNLLYIIFGWILTNVVIRLFVNAVDRVYGERIDNILRNAPNRISALGRASRVFISEQTSRILVQIFRVFLIVFFLPTYLFYWLLPKSFVKKMGFDTLYEMLFCKNAAYYYIPMMFRPGVLSAILFGQNHIHAHTITDAKRWVTYKLSNLDKVGNKFSKDQLEDYRKVLEDKERVERIQRKGIGAKEAKPIQSRKSQSLNEDRIESQSLDRIAKAQEEANRLLKLKLELEEKERLPFFEFGHALSGSDGSSLTLKNSGKRATFLGVEDREASDISVDAHSKTPHPVDTSQNLVIEFRSRKPEIPHSRVPYEFRIIFEDVAGKRYYQTVKFNGVKYVVSFPET